MADYNVQDVPLRVLEMLRIFLAASSRGEEASLVLETRKGKLTTKYRCVETVTGVPDPTSTNCTKKRMNPARARRSKQAGKHHQQENRREAEGCWRH